MNIVRDVEFVLFIVCLLWAERIGDVTLKLIVCGVCLLIAFKCEWEPRLVLIGVIGRSLRMMLHPGGEQGGFATGSGSGEQQYAGQRCWVCLKILGNPSMQSVDLVVGKLVGGCLSLLL